ncbi:MAG TPA: hypothetical protein PK819_11170 [Thermomicrobiales bacterium]|nr:hypothetical protein [Thermomicrobiales bacterium]
MRPGGRLRFLRSHPLAMMCAHDDENVPHTNELLRPQNDLYRLDWGADGVEFTLPHGQMIDLLHKTGFVLEELRELFAPANATTTYPYVTAEWASKWPHEEVWKARKPLS